VGEEPEEEGKCCAEDEAGDDGEIEGGVFAAMDDVAGELSKAERKFPAGIKKSADEDEEAAEEEEGAAKFAERVHNGSLEQTGLPEELTSKMAVESPT
jgi:hypothetical protein